MTPETCDTDIFSLAEDTAMLLQLDAGSKNLILNIKGGHTVIQADPSKMKQVLFNLMLNAVQAAPENSEITVSVNRHSLKIVNEIKDADFDRTKIGTPFYTTKTVGTGLGLAIVNRILTLHGFGLKITADKSFIAEITF
jgi:two-component system sensor histidine kinase HydH